LADRFARSAEAALLDSEVSESWASGKTTVALAGRESKGASNEANKMSDVRFGSLFRILFGVRRADE
jgi:hypothetical protein